MCIMYIHVTVSTYMFANTAIYASEGMYMYVYVSFNAL